MGRESASTVTAVPLDPSSVLLTDRVVVVTGAARGLGAAIARVFARFGARLAVCDRDADGLGGVADEVSAIASGAFDVRDAAAVEGFVGSLDRVDVLVNNAGGTFFSPFLDVNQKGEQALIAENFGQVTSFVRRVVPRMPEGGSIVNVTSIEAHQAAPGFAVYAAMKAAVASLTKTLALELGPRGIRVNAIAPDAIPTTGDEVLQADVRAGAAYEPATDPPLGFLGDPEDAAGVALFLASDLSRFVTGTTVHVDGGNWAAGGWRRTIKD